MVDLTQGLRRAAQIKPGGVSTICGARRRFWRETEERVARLAGGLARHGLGKGSRAAILALNSDRYYEALFAVPLLGALTVPVNIRLAPPELAYIFADCTPEILFIDRQFAAVLDVLAGRMASVRTVVYLDDDAPPAGAVAFEALLDAKPVTTLAAQDDEPAGIFYTGGTTGMAKGVVLSHRNLVANAANMTVAVGYDAETVYLHAPPMFHAADGASTYAATMAGGTHVFIPRFDPETVLAATQQHRVTHTLLVPTMINIVANFPRLADYDTSSLQAIPFGASPMPEAVLKKAMAMLPRVRFTHLYGMTEASPLATALDWRYVAGAEPFAGRQRSCGRAGFLTEVRITGPDDAELPRGTVGEVQVRGPNVMLGYWNRPEQTAQAMRAGWYHSGDGGYMDADGFVYIVDRLKDMIVTGGENVYSAEVESVISTLDGVAETAVIGIPDPEWGEAVHAFVVPRPGAAVTEAVVAAHCRERIANYKCPRSVTIRDEPLPLSGAGKILKTELREPYWRGHDKRVN